MAGGGSASMVLKAHYNNAVPLTRHTERVMVEIIGPSSAKKKTAELDLVLVVDTSGSMKGDKLKDMQKAAEFVVRKMGKEDTLTIVPFSSKAGNPSAKPPTPMKDDAAKQTMIKFIKGLTANGNTNIQDGLKTAVDLVHSRQSKVGRAAGIFLLTDGDQHVGDGRLVDVHDLPVFTFGLGQAHNENLLKDIAVNSHGGTYNVVKHPASRMHLTECFAGALAILRDISVLNVSVTLKPHAGARIVKVQPGKYPVSDANGSFTIGFGEMGRKERRTIFVDLQLPAVPNIENTKKFMDIDCTYRPAKERRIVTDRTFVNMARNRGARLRAPSDHFEVEQARHDHVLRMGNMVGHADRNEFGKAKDEWAKAHKSLSSVEPTDNTVDLHDALCLELEHLQELLESHDAYKKLGRAYMLAAILSHERQRFAARGHDEDVMIFVLPRMHKYRSHAHEFHNNPNARI